jgi:alpha-glucosidase
VIAADPALDIEFLSARVARLRLLVADAPPSGFSVALPYRDESRAAPAFEVVREAVGLTFRDLAGNVLVQMTEARGQPPRACFKRATEEHYYGLGQAGPGLDKEGTSRRLWNGHYGYGRGSDMVVPLVISSRGYGLFFDNSWAADIVLGNTFTYSAEGGQLDFYFIYGPEPAAILSEYANLTGHPPMPPAWSLGYIQSTRHFDSPDEIVELAQTLRDKRIPCDAIVFLSTYGEDMGMNNGVGTLEFHPRLWADAAALMHELRAREFHVVSHEYPVISPKSAHFDEAVNRGYVIDYAGANTSVMFNEGQRFLDFSNPEVGAWWWDQHAELVESGVDGWWLDGGEGPPAEVELRGGSGAALHNAFDFLRQQAFVDGGGRARPNRRPWLLCRSGYAGMQRLGSATWSGDINNTFGVFEAQLPLGLSTAMSGVPYWGTDIGGFFHTVPESPELFVRWFQFAAFCPVFRSHGRGIGRRGWREHLPWAHGSAIESICRAFGELRYQLLPYNYSLAWQAHTQGVPLMRPLVLEFPSDPNVVDMSSEYMWGPSMLVAPVTRGGATRWPVYLPGGTWYDFWTDARFSGGQWVEADAPLERMPLFVRGGAIIPMGPVRQHFQPSADLTLLVFPAGDSTFELFEDDGVSRDYEHGSYSLTTLRCSDSRLIIEPARGSYAATPPERTIVVQTGLESRTVVQGPEPIEIDLRK